MTTADLVHCHYCHAPVPFAPRAVYQRAVCCTCTDRERRTPGRFLPRDEQTDLDLHPSVLGAQPQP